MDDFKENILRKVRVLIIDDSEFKYTQIKDSLNRLISPQITWCRSRNSGLALILKHNVKQVFEPFDFIITDNIMPLRNDEIDLKPYAKNIVDVIRERGLKDLPIIVCSSADIEECDYNYIIKYDSSVSLDEIFQKILTDMEFYKEIQKKEEIVDCKNYKNINRRVDIDEQNETSILGKYKLKKNCNYKTEQYSPLAYEKFEQEKVPILTKKKNKRSLY